ncbi:MAG: threonylcarbamoyl-AMP synthase [Chitinivibrionales bacterium]|nr:threonylcarbamoyl-AMP synthase [Chitinivibrionales bacterium]MBD3396741.1 threonylcarbamoyl-AMP synthase [Chitinivibrionales bacterium]
MSTRSPRRSSGLLEYCANRRKESLSVIHYEIHPQNPQQRLLEQAANILKNENGVCVYPTDTVYGMGACATNAKAVNRIGTLLQKDKKRLFSYICSDFHQVSRYARMENWQFKLMRRYLPGPYTFVLLATNFVPRKVCPKRKTVGIRIPDNPVCLALTGMLDEPLANTSIRLPGHQRGDALTVRTAVVNEVDIMLDAGALENPTGSTIIDLTGSEPVIIREGKGPWHG